MSTEAGSSGDPSRVDGQRHYAGWIERLAYRWMDDVLKTGWTPEKAAPFYGGISEEKMRSMVDYARRNGFLK
jgi:hypothetical protein